jgi:hypothetical protein
MSRKKAKTTSQRAAVKLDAPHYKGKSVAKPTNRRQGDIGRVVSMFIRRDNKTFVHVFDDPPILLAGPFDGLLYIEGHQEFYVDRQGMIRNK